MEMKFYSLLNRWIFIALGQLRISGEPVVISLRRHVPLTVWTYFSCLVTWTLLSTLRAWLPQQRKKREFSSERVVFGGVTAAIFFQANSHLLNATPCRHLSLWRPRKLTCDMVLAASVSVLSFRRRRCCWCALRASHVGRLLGEIIRLLA